jgi:hypothetical protein
MTNDDESVRAGLSRLAERPEFSVIPAAEIDAWHRRATRRTRVLAVVSGVVVVALIAVAASRLHSISASSDVPTHRPPVSATTTAFPKQLTGKWVNTNEGPARVMVIGRRGKVNNRLGARRYYMTFSQVNVTDKRHGRLTMSGPRSCSGTGRYGWTILKPGPALSTHSGWGLRLTKIHDACKARVDLFRFYWAAAGGRSLN